MSNFISLVESDDSDSDREYDDDVDEEEEEEDDYDDDYCNNNNDDEVMVVRRNPRRRGRTQPARSVSVNNDDNSNKRKRASSSPLLSKKYFHTDVVAEDFLCPITHELPVDDPVVAMDGMVYEGVAITTWISNRLKHGVTVVNSPWTGEPMGSTDTVAAPRKWKNKLDECVNKICDNTTGKDEEYVERYKQKKQFLSMVAGATKSKDVVAMEKIAMCYQTGEYGVEVSEDEAFHWYNLAYKHGSVIGMANAGDLMVHGSGTKKNVVHATRIRPAFPKVRDSTEGFIGSTTGERALISHLAASNSLVREALDQWG